MSYRHSATTRAVLTSLVPVICPPEAVHLAEPIVTNMEQQFDSIPPLLQHALTAGFLAYDLGALPRYRRRAQRLAPEQADPYFQTWEHGITPMHREFATRMTSLMSLACYEQPEMMERVGYRVGPWIEQVTKKRLTMFADDIKRQAAQILAPDPLRPAAPAAKATTGAKKGVA
jgi:hypothetical protein